jgi:hypothetical protein
MTHGFTTYDSPPGRKRFIMSVVLCFVAAIVLLVWR